MKVWDDKTDLVNDGMPFEWAEHPHVSFGPNWGLIIVLVMNCAVWAGLIYALLRYLGKV